MNDYFEGSINGVSASDLYAKIDYSKSSLADRLLIVNEICDTGFFHKYFENHYDVITNSDDNLSEHNNICKLLENLGTYLLGSKEEVERRKSDNEYKYFDSSYLIRKINYDASLESIVDSTHAPAVALDNIKKNDVAKIAINKSITYDSKDPYNITDDMSIDHETMELIKGYVDYYNRLDKSQFSKQQIDRIKGGIAQDIETLVESNYRDVIHNNMHINSSTQYYDEDLDISKRHVLSGLTSWGSGGTLERERGLLFMPVNQGINPNNNLNIILNDLNNMVGESNLTEREAMVLQLLREGYNMGDIAKKVGVHPNTITSDRKKIINKVLKTIKNKQRRDV